MSARATCRGCGAEIVWARWAESGKAAPFDAAPGEDGPAVLVKESGQMIAYHRHRMPVGAWHGDAKPEGYMPHHATCPKADEFRRMA